MFSLGSLELTLLLMGLPTVFFPLGYYIGEAYVQEDALFFMRKRQFHQKVLNSGYQHTLELIETLLMSSEQDWQHVGRFMYYKPFSDTKIVFENSYGLNLSIFEGKGNKQVFELLYRNDSQKFDLKYDAMNKQGLSPQEQFRMQQVMVHLNEILIKNQRKEDELLQRHEQKKKNDSFVKKEMKVAELLWLIKNYPSLQQVVKKDGFTLSFTAEKDSKYLEISLDKTVYFQAIQMNGQSSMKTAIQNREHEVAQIFMDCATPLYQYAATLFGQKVQTTAMAFSGEHKKTFDLIQELLTQLKEEKAWLSTESWHKVNETLPHDLQALGESYQLVQEKGKAHQHVKDALHSIHQKLQVFAEEAENNKLKAVERQKRIIEKR